MSPTIRQLSLFLDNRVGQLLRLFQAFHGQSVRVIAVNIVNAIDCAIVRVICDDTDAAKQLLHEADFPASETELIVVELPAPTSLPTICAVLLSAELNISYIYPLLIQPSDLPAVAIHCDDNVTAANILQNKKFKVLTEEDLGPGPLR
jgi:hypothetical protein